LSLQADFLHHGGTSSTLPINLFFMYYEYMARKQRGRPATGQVPVTAVRLLPELKSKSEFDGFLDCIIIESLHNPIADA
jgi:hypothetical protein